MTVLGCVDATTAPDPSEGDLRPFEPVGLAAPWEVVSPRQVGADAARTAAAVAQAEAIPRFRSLLAVKDGKIFVERYFAGADASTLFDVRSVTKSIVSTLTGLAVEEGHLTGLDQTLGEILPPEIGLSDEQERISIRHLLTMTAGFEWNESGGDDYQKWINSEDHIAALLERPLIAEPGTRFTYNSAAVHLLGVALETAVGETLPSLARRRLFAPIGISRVAWEPFLEGRVNGGSGIDLRARDLARFGQLFLQDGMSADQRVLPTGWVEEATSPAFSWRAAYGPLTRYTYGRLWWISESQPETAFLAWGYGGQYVYVVPDLRVVVVATTEWRGLSQEGGPSAIEPAVLDVLVNGLHVAARG